VTTQLTDAERDVLLTLVRETNKREDTVGCLMRFHAELGNDGPLRLAKKLEAGGAPDPDPVDSCPCNNPLPHQQAGLLTHHRCPRCGREFVVKNGRFLPPPETT